jgi:hypothetical protein
VARACDTCKVRSAFIRWLHCVVNTFANVRANRGGKRNAMDRILVFYASVVVESRRASSQTGSLLDGNGALSLG